MGRLRYTGTIWTTLYVKIAKNHSLTKIGRGICGNGA